jgi:hypothetical protein
MWRHGVDDPGVDDLGADGVVPAPIEVGGEALDGFLLSLGEGRDGLGEDD